MNGRPSTRRSRSATRWLATVLLGVLLCGAVLPGLVSALLPSAQAKGLLAFSPGPSLRGGVALPVEVCGGRGSRWVLPQADPHSPSPVQPAHAAHSEDCPYCRWDHDLGPAWGGPADGPYFLASTGPWPRANRAGIVVAGKPDRAHRPRAPPGSMAS